MTFQELQHKIGEQNESDWHQHKNARVENTVFIGENAIVWGTVYANAWVSGNAHDEH